MFTLKLENDKNNEVNINDGVNYLVTSVTGLNPPSASLFTSKSPNRKGSKYNGSSLDERNIVLTIKLLGDIEKNRNKLYGWVDSESYIKVKYANGVKNVYCEGHVEECEVDLFTDNEVMVIAIVCSDPYWKDLQEISYEVSTILKQFVFPFAINSVGIPFATIKETNTTYVFNGGAETGALFTIRCLNQIKNLTIYDPNDTSKQFVINKTFEKDSVIKINTDTSPKTVRLYKPDGTNENLLKNVVRNPTWFTLKKGNNSFGYTSDSSLTDIEITISFTNKYLGV